MNFFKRKPEEKLELPELSNSGKLPEFPELPSLPESHTEEQHEQEQLRPLPSFSQPIAPQPALSRSIMMPERKSMDLAEFSKSKESIKEPIFVKLDKFKDAVEKFEQIKVKVSEIDDSLKKLREIKDREEHELRSWEEEVRSIKEKVASIDSSLFSKI